MTVHAPESDRLRLRQWRQRDKEPFAELNADPEVMMYFPSALTRARSDAIVDRCAALIAENGWGFWAVECKSNGDFLGLIGLHIPSADLPFSPCVEVGWRLARPHWGKGYATEGARAALRFGFEVLGLEEIVSFTAVANLRSQAVMHRLGLVKTDTFDHPAVPAESGLKEHCLYRIAARTFRAGPTTVGPV